nr:peptidylprolyl isomerase [Chitinophagaceae bacterium]
DIDEYIKENKLKYNQEAAGRVISYVSFNAASSAKDSMLAREQVMALKKSFSSDTNAKAFIARNISSINYFDGYSLRSKLQMPDKDSIIALPDGAVYGPYLDGSNYVIAKKISTKLLPDSIKVRHILLGTADPQTGQQLMADSVAKQKIDSIEMAIKGGADFNALETVYSTDKTAHKDDGVMTFDIETIQGENLAKEFADFILNENGETKKTVKTQFGWHYIEILEKKNLQPAFKVAYMAKEIVPGEETINTANVAATKLASESRSEKELDAYIKKPGINKNKVTPPEVKESDYLLGGLQDAREIIKWAFEAKEGEVSEPFSLKDEFVVAVVSKKTSKGLPDEKTARPMVESIIRNKKKADEIIKKLNNPATLDAAAGIYKKQVLTTGDDSTLTFNALIINGIGNEPKVAGASFYKGFQTKVSPPIVGNTGVFLIKINNIHLKPADLPEDAERMKSMRMMEIIQGNQGGQKPGVLGSSFNALKEMAEVKDKRSDFF